MNAFLYLVAVLAFRTGTYPADPVDASLKIAGANRSEIQKVLDHYAGDARKLEAARYVVANMNGKAYKVVSLVDAKGRSVPYDCLKYPNLNTAMNAMDALEKAHGPLTEKSTPTYDLQHLKADFLIEHIDGAFEAWKTLPWAKDVAWETFRDYVLPYRGGKEPAESWRKELMERFTALPGTMKDPTDMREAAGIIESNMNNWVGFWDLYYLHPTEQGFSEMKASRKGRCGDLSNLATFALRANGIPCAIDYTPFWADANNNHAWPVVLDREGVGHESVSKAAKIYRKTFANHEENLCYQADKNEKLPPWLDRPDYVDVTTQYLPTTDVTIPLHNSPKRASHAYLCVFNTGEWCPIQWSEVVDGKATFSAMGRGIAYLPVWWTAKGVAAADSPFILDSDGRIHQLAPDTERRMDVLVCGTSRGADATPDGKPLSRLTAGKTCELFYYEDGWKSAGKQTATASLVNFANVPSGCLYWLVEDGGRHEERIFTVESGKQAWW